MRRILVAAAAVAMFASQASFAGPFKKPRWAHSIQRESQRALDSSKQAVKGQVRIRVSNSSDFPMAITSNVGGQKIWVEPHRVGTYTKANIGDKTAIYGNGHLIRNLGVLTKNFYFLTYSSENTDVEKR
jgi:hypothetical protein